MKSTPQNPSKSVAPFAVMALMVLLFAVPAGAQPLFWDGGTVDIGTNGDGLSQGTAGTWDNITQNWDQGAGLPHVAWNSGYDAVFAAPGIAANGGTVTLGDVITANSLTVSTANYIFTDAGNSANTLAVNYVTNTANTTMSNNIVNGGTFEKDGGSTLTLLAASPELYGLVNVNAGTLAFGSSTAGAPTGPQSVTSVYVATNAVFQKLMNAGGTPSEAVSGGGSYFVQANSYTSTVLLENANTYTGGTTINQVTAQFTSVDDSAPNPLGNGTNVFLCTGASTSILQYKGYGDTTSRALTLGGKAGSQLDSSGYGPLVWNGPAVPATNAGAMRILTLTGTSSYLNVFGGTIADGTATNMALQKAGTGTWLVTASNAFTGGATLSGGTLLITNDYAMGVSTGRVFCSSSSTLKSTNNDVLFGASRWTIVTNTATLSFGVTDTNNLTVASFITGPGAVSKSGSSYALGTVRFSNDTNNFTGAFTTSFGNTEFTSVGNSGAPSALGTGITNSGTIVLANGTSAGMFRYVGANNDSTTRPLNWTGASGSAYALDASGGGTIAYLATGTLKSGSGSMTLNLQGSNTGPNTLAQVINDSGGTTTLTKMGTGQWVLTGANTFGGTTTISGGTLTVSSDGNLGTAPGAATPNSLTLNGGALSASASFTLNANRGIALGPTGTNALSNNGPAVGDGTIDVAGGQTLTYGGIMGNNTSTNSGGLMKTSAGKLILSGVNTYTGDTTISAGTLALTGSASIAASTNIIIGAAATFDVSGVAGGYSLVAGQNLVATNGAVATISGSLNVGPASVVITNVANTPTITVTGGTLALAGNSFTVNVNNGGAGLSAGSYKLISKGAGGMVSGAVPASVTVGGDGLASGATATLSISNSELYLVVTGGTLYPPVIGGLSVSGGQAVLSFTGTNGQTWKVLTSTNLALAVTNWSLAATGAFNGTLVNYTNPSQVDPKRFYLITCP